MLVDEPAGNIDQFQVSFLRGAGQEIECLDARRSIFREANLLVDGARGVSAVMCQTPS